MPKLFELLYNAGKVIIGIIHGSVLLYTGLPEVDDFHQRRLEAVVKTAPRGREGVDEGSVDTLCQSIWICLCIG